MLDENGAIKIRTNLTLRTKNWGTKIVLNSKANIQKAREYGVFRLFEIHSDF